MPNTLITDDRTSIARTNVRDTQILSRHLSTENGTTRLLVDLGPLIRIFCSSETLISCSRILQKLAPTNSSALIDQLHCKTVAKVLNGVTSDKKVMTFEMSLHTTVSLLKFDLGPEDDQLGNSVRPIVNTRINGLFLTYGTSEEGYGENFREPNTKLTSHVRASEILIWLSEPDKSLHVQDLVTLSVNNPTLQTILKSSSKKISCTVERIESKVQGDKILRLPVVMDRISASTDVCITSWKDFSRLRKTQLQQLIAALLSNGVDTPDPAFLTSGNYITRLTSHHVRVSDSWKLLSRLRQLFRGLSESSKESIIGESSKWSLTKSEECASWVVNAFEQWRTWDITDVRQSVLLQQLFGTALESTNKSVTDESAAEVLCQIDLFRTLIFSGKQSNELLLDGFKLNIDRSNRVVQVKRDVPATVPMMQIQCSTHRILLATTWDLCELVSQYTKSRVRREKAKSQSLPTQKFHIHVLVSTDVLSFSFGTVNTKSSITSKGLKISALRADLMDSHITLTSHSSGIEIAGLTKQILSVVLERPRLSLSSSTPNTATAREHSLRVCGIYKRLQLKILEDPLFLIHLSQTVMQDDLDSIQATLRSTQHGRMQRNNVSTAGIQSRFESVQVIFVLESYTLNIKVLPSLHYVLSGQAAKGRVEYVMDTHSKTLIDFDVLRYVHAFVTSTDPHAETISSFAFPPMYGHLKLSRTEEEQNLVARGVVEEISFDARSVHALLVILNKPEIASFANRLQKESHDFSTSLQSFVYRNESEGPRIPGKEVSTQYDVCFSMAGLSVIAKAPGSMDSSGKVVLQLGLGGLYLRARNHGNTSEVRTVPDLEVKLVGTGARLFHSTGEEKKSIGDISIQAIFRASSVFGEDGNQARVFSVQSKRMRANLQVATLPALVDILGHLQKTLKDIDLGQEVNTLRKLRHPSRVNQLDLPSSLVPQRLDEDHRSLKSLFSAMYSLDMGDIRIIWRIEESSRNAYGRPPEDLVFSVSKLEFATRKANFARLSVQNVQLQMTPHIQRPTFRASNSALLPEVVFNVAYMSSTKDRRLAFYAAGKALDLRLTSQFILPVSDLRRSIARSVHHVRQVTAQWHFLTPQSEDSKKHILSEHGLASLQIDADFAGAVVHLQGSNGTKANTKSANILRSERVSQREKPSQAMGGGEGLETTLRSPGVAFKLHYKDAGKGTKTLNAETKVSASSNILHSSVVPLITEIISSVKEVMGEPLEEQKQIEPSPPVDKLNEPTGVSADPSSIFGDCQISLGLRICKQDFGLTCQPIAKVAATAQLDEVYIAVNTVQHDDHTQFFSLSAAVKNATTEIQHAYSRESTVQLKVTSIFISAMNSKHVGGAEGMSVFMKIGPANATVNARQIQDVLLFRDIWIPAEIREVAVNADTARPSESQAVMIRRYQQVAAANAFSWNAIVRMAEVDIRLDLGQSLGMSTLIVSQIWMSSNKTSQAEQNLCFGLATITGRSTGRMSGQVELQDVKLRTSIKWPLSGDHLKTVPLIQASAGFETIKVKAGLDYQTFAVALITGFDFLMYNIQDAERSSNDHLVAILKSETAHVYCTSLSASQALALWQAGERFVSEKQMAYQVSSAEIDQYLRRRPSMLASARQPKVRAPVPEAVPKAPLQLRTKVVVALGSLSFGCFPSTFSDNQVFKLEALDVSARFSSMLKQERIQSDLGLKLGQLRISLSSVVRPSSATSIEELDIDHLVGPAVRPQGGTILKVPMVLASMQTWQDPHSRHIEFVFKSSFQGRVDVGWSYARISFIREMWNRHTRALAQRLGKPLPKSAVQITSGPPADGETPKNPSDPSQQAKITAVVNVPLSKYTYTALEPPVIETPQLRDMGEATPPLEWIGLHRERLPNVTHQIVIVSLLELAKEVEDAYARILGISSA